MPDESIHNAEPIEEARLRELFARLDIGAVPVDRASLAALRERAAAEFERAGIAGVDAERRKSASDAPWRRRYVWLVAPLAAAALILIGARLWWNRPADDGPTFGMVL